MFTHSKGFDVDVTFVVHTEFLSLLKRVSGIVFKRF